ncbi:MAG: methyltransferase domain-containing protein [Saprospiraceae bacterium]|nr:methyltransferase domain-containing protein [Saprospiraceae bacterium]
MTGPKVHWWQRLLSFVMEVPLQNVEGEYNPYLQVSLVRNRFQLSTQNAIYSFDDLYLNFSRAFEKVDLPPNDASLLLLGLGLGSIPFILENKFDRKYQITAVEFDEAVISLATTFTFPRLIQKIQVIHADAEIYVQMDRKHYDFLIVDLFLDDVIPPYFESNEGLRNLKKLLNPGGMILINRLYRNASDRQKTGNFYNGTFLSVFHNGYHLDVDGNWILVGKG